MTHAELAAALQKSLTANNLVVVPVAREHLTAAAHALETMAMLEGETIALGINELSDEDVAAIDAAIRAESQINEKMVEAHRLAKKMFVPTPPTNESENDAK